ncbi:MAG: hypothetical protein AAGC93_12395 [Cyanobacteria bacterium P01_F01_bin.53]
MPQFINAQIDGPYVGTSEADSLSGLFEITDATFNIAEAGIINANIATLAGDDRVEGISVVALAPNAQATAAAFGVANTSIDFGSGNDALAADSTSLAGFSGVATSYGIVGSQVFGRGGKDTLFAIARSQSRIDATAIAVSSSLLSGGNHDDNIVISSRITTQTEELASGLSVGVETATIRGDQGNDTIRVSAQGVNLLHGSEPARVSDTETVVGLKSLAGIFGNSGNDFIQIKATGNAELQATVVGSQNSKILGGTGHDTIEVTAQATGDGTASAIGLKDSLVKGGAGSDTITVTTQVSATGTSDGYGAQSSKVYGGSGDDLIRIRIDNGGTLDITDSLVHGGRGNDTIDVGIGDVTIKGGTGNDTVVLDYLQQPGNHNFAIAALGNGLNITGSLTQSNSFSESWQQRITGVENFTVAGTTYSAEALISTFGSPTEIV